ncbi:MAG: amidohydrolase family protein [Deltaproteobacteria bacterium]|nr:amidohydrolase family protein [Deltaproteobacteria bacterium]
MTQPSKPALKLPPGACDAHVHVFGPGRRFPYLAGRKATPSDAPKEMLFALHEFLGIDHCVIVHTASHGTDNAATADALAAKGGAYRGVALVQTTISDADLKALDAAGFCGARFHYIQHLAKTAPIDEVIDFGKRLVDIGWHLQIHMQADLIVALTPAIRRSPVPVVIDHMGRVDASLGLDQPAFNALLRLMDDKNIWVKVSGCDRATRQGPPYADAVPFARKLVAEFGDRTVWGTDWPHPNHAGPIPDDGTLVDIIAEFAPSEAQRQALLVDNPRRFYRFAPVRRAAMEVKQ